MSANNKTGKNHNQHSLLLSPNPLFSTDITITGNNNNQQREHKQNNNHTTAPPAAVRERGRSTADFDFEGFVPSDTSEGGRDEEEERGDPVEWRRERHQRRVESVVDMGNLYRRFTRDPCGAVCAILTYVLIAYGAYVTNVDIIWGLFSFSVWGMFHSLFYNLTALMALASQIKCMFADPGYVNFPKSSNDIPMERITRGKPIEKYGEMVLNCYACNDYKPLGAHHCSICGHCVRRMDHHCPWVNNCVGEYNLKHFMQFLFYIFLMSSYSLWLVFFRLYDCAQSDFKYCDYLSSQFAVFKTVSLIFEAAVFGIFVIAMFVDQICNAKEGLTGIDRLQSKESETDLSIYGSLVMIFGTTISPYWFCPYGVRGGRVERMKNREDIVYHQV